MSSYLKAAKMVSNKNIACCKALMDVYKIKFSVKRNIPRTTFYKHLYNLYLLFQPTPNTMFFWGATKIEQNQLARSIALLLMHEMQKSGDL